MTELTFTLTKAAAKSGGDKYTAPHGNGEFIVYFPQTISRVDGVPKKKLCITIGEA